mgnify:FL=1
MQEPLEQWLNLPSDGAARLTLNVALHFGTLLSILVVYRSDLLRLLQEPRKVLPIVVATIPVVIAGFTLKGWIEEHLQTPLVAAGGLLVTAALLLLGQRLERTQSSIASVTWAAAIVIGVFQAVALVPGISRSGSTSRQPRSRS